jgi:putative membrane protein
VLSASVAVFVMDIVNGNGGLMGRLEACPFMLDDLVSFVYLWSFDNGFYGNWVPAALTVGDG